MGRHRAAARGDLRRGCRLKLRDGRWRACCVVPLLAVAVALIWWRGPDWHVVRDAFTVVRWPWVVAAIGLNLLSVVARALAWNTTIQQSIDPPAPALPARLLGVLASGCSRTPCCRAASASSRASPCCARRMPGRQGCDGDADRLGVRAPDVRPLPGDGARHLGAARREAPALGGDDDRVVLARRARAVRSSRWCCARRAHRDALEGLGTVRQLLVRARHRARGDARAGRRRRPRRRSSSSAGSASCSPSGRRCTRSTSTSRSSAAGLVLVLMNVATIFPLWPGNVGLVQAAIAVSARQLRRRLRARLRVRDRPAGDRGVGRRRGRACLPRARGALLRDAQGDRRAVEAAERGARGRADRTCSALASPASLKGVLSPLEAAALAR